MTVLLAEEDIIKYPGLVSIAISYPSEPGKIRPLAHGTFAFKA
jgi:hypothetical protein